MAVVPQFRELIPGSKFTQRILQLIFTGNYTTGGDALDLRPQAITNSAQDPLGGVREFIGMPDLEYVLNDSGGFWIELIRGGSPNALQSYLCKVFAPGGAEQAAGAYPAGMTAPTSPFLIGLNHKTLH